MSDERNFKILMNRVLAGDRNSAYPPIQEWEKSAISWAMTQLDELAELRAKAEVRAVTYGQTCCGNPEDCPKKYTADCIPREVPPAQAVSVPNEHKPGCASFSVLLLSNPPQRAQCDCGAGLPPC